MGISENILTIADNTDDVIEVVSSAQKQVQGPYIKVDDVANIEHNVPCRLENKNLVDLYGYSASSISNPTATRSLVNTSYGTTLSTIEPENSVTVTQSKIGNETDVQHYSNGYICVGFYNDIPENTVVTFSFEVDITNNPLNATSMGIMCNGAFGFNKATQINNRWVSTGTYKNNGDRRYIEIRISGISGTFSNFQLELGSTATPYTPYITDFSQVEVSRYGKNLLDYTKATDRFGNPLTIIENGVLWDKTISFYFHIPCFVPKGVAFVLTCKSDFEENPDIINAFNAICEDGTNFYGSLNNAYTLTSNVVYLRIRKRNANTSETTPIKVTNLQVELGDTATEYEPYNGTTYQSTTEGVVDGVTSISPNMTLLTNADGVVILARYFPQGTEKMCADFTKLKMALHDAEKLFKGV